MSGPCKLTVSVVECSKCHSRFNYEWSASNSWGSLWLGNRSIFRCPTCKELNSFDLGNRGRDPALPTTNDMEAGVGGRIWGLLIGPFLLLIGIGVALNVTLAGSPYYALQLVPILGGIAWLAVYAFYLNKKIHS